MHTAERQDRFHDVHGEIEPYNDTPLGIFAGVMAILPLAVMEKADVPIHLAKVIMKLRHVTLPP